MQRLAELHPAFAGTSSPRRFSVQPSERPRSVASANDADAYGAQSVCAIHRTDASPRTSVRPSTARRRTLGDIVLSVLDRSSSTVRKQQLKAAMRATKRWQQDHNRPVGASREAKEVEYPSLTTVLDIIRAEGAAEYERQRAQIAQVAGLRQSHYREALRRTSDVAAVDSEPSKFEMMMARR